MQAQYGKYVARKSTKIESMFYVMFYVTKFYWNDDDDDDGLSNNKINIIFNIQPCLLFYAQLNTVSVPSEQYTLHNTCTKRYQSSIIKQSQN